MYVYSKVQRDNLLQRRNKVDYRKIAMIKRYFMNEKVRQKVIMSSPIFIFCYFWESFDTLFFEQKSKYIYYTHRVL